ncbi:MAG: cell division protein FtsQ/DivIB [Oligoflexales bacterium]
MKKTKKSKNSVLSKQKPKRKAFKGIARRVAKPLGLAIVATGFAYFLYSNAISVVAQQPVNWQVAVRNANTEASSDTDLIAKRASKYLNENGRRDRVFERLASDLQSFFLLRSVNIIRSDYNKVVITVEKRSPVAAIEGKHLYLVDRDSEIFGEARGDGLKLPMLIGFLPDDKPTWQEDHTMAVNAETKVAIKEAIQLLADSARHSFEVSKIKNISQRGFEIYVNGDLVSAIVGRAPFEKKLTRLTQLLKTENASPNVATRIELDYDDKAFIGQTNL